MRTIAVAALLSIMPFHVLAASPEDPVRRMMELAAARLDQQPGGGEYFEAPRLARDYSARFADAYISASRYPAYDDGSGNPFGYDVIANGQDGCPLEDIAYGEHESSGAMTTVTVRFKLWQCVPKTDPS